MRPNQILKGQPSFEGDPQRGGSGAKTLRIAHDSFLQLASGSVSEAPTACREDAGVYRGVSHRVKQENSVFQRGLRLNRPIHWGRPSFLSGETAKEKFNVVNSMPYMCGAAQREHFHVQPKK
jgi:hypothetical protein